MSFEDIDRIRHFNRFYTRRMGLLSRDYVGEGLGVTELRVFYEVATDPEGAAREIARRLELDEGYLSRILKRFVDGGWITRKRLQDDGRKKRLALTESGEALFEELVRRTRKKTEERLNGANPEMVAEAMERLERMFSPASPDEVSVRDLSHGDAGWVIQRHAETYGQSHGFNAEFELLVSEILTGFQRHRDPGRERAFIAHRQGERLGSIFCMASDDPTLAKLRLFFVEPSARGLGLGRQLMDDCLGFAREAGFQRMTLMTHQSLDAARHLYSSYGFSCSDAVEVRHYGQHAVEETWDVAF